MEAARPLLEKQAEGDRSRYLCDLCHQANGVAFADRFWTCQQCKGEVYLWLRLEETSPAVQRRKPC